VNLPAVGPLPRFAEAHVRRSLELIAKHKAIGRKRLAEELGVGEGSVRTILSQLKRQGLIRSSGGGHELTSKGRRELGRAGKFVEVDAGDLTVGEVDIATLIKGAASKVKRGIEQRDEAIKAGAEGATVLIFRNGRLRFPDGFFKIANETAERLMASLEPEDGDVIIIGTASDAVKAEAGARAAARTLHHFA